MIRDLIDGNKAEGADVAYTDIDECKLSELRENLRLLVKLDLNFVLLEEQNGKSCEESGGSSAVFKLSYKGKPISIDFLKGCSGEDWFRNQEFGSSDVFIQHDSSGHEVHQVLFMALQYFRAAKQSGKTPLVIMEDLRKMRGSSDRSFVRHFDLELLGKLHSGKHPYGHRSRQKTELSDFSETQACRKEEEVVKYSILQHGIAYTAADVKKWIGIGVAPDPYMDLNVETGEPAFRNAVTVKVHPELAELSEDAYAVMMEVSLIANNESSYLSGMTVHWYPRIRDTFKGSPEREYLFEPNFFAHMAENLSKIFEVLEKINPRLVEAFAVRALQTLVKLREKLPSFVETNYAENPQNGYQRVLAILEIIKSKLGKNRDVKEFEKFVEATRNNHPRGRHEILAASLRRLGRSGDLLFARVK